MASSASSSARRTCPTRSRLPPTRRWPTVCRTAARCAAGCRRPPTRRSTTRRPRTPRTPRRAPTSPRSAARSKRHLISRSRREPAFFRLAAQQPLFGRQQTLGLAEQHHDIPRLQPARLGGREARARAGAAYRAHLHAVGARRNDLGELAPNCVGLGLEGHGVQPRDVTSALLGAARKEAAQQAVLLVA